MNGQTLTRHPHQLQEALRLHQAGHPVEARARYEKLLKREPANVDLLKLQGLACIQLGDFGRGEAYLRRALALRADDAELMVQMGSVLTQLRKNDEALEWLERAVRMHPGRVDPHFYLGQILVQVGRYQDAIGAYAQALSLDPSHFGAWRGSATATAALKHFQDALNFYDIALKLRPEDVDILNDRAAVYAQMGDHTRALLDYDELVRRSPNYPKGWNNRGVCLDELGRIDEAVASFKKAIALDARFAEPHSNMAKALMRHVRVDEAISSCDRALAIKPDYADAAMNRSMSIMTAGRLREGFEAYESRWRRHGALGAGSSAPRWMGTEDITGRTLLILSEQGLGDTLQFSRYALEALSRVGPQGKVVMQAQKPVMRLLQTLDHRVVVIDAAGPLPHHDYYCPMLSLPLAFGTDIDNIPAPVPYLHAAPEAVARWQTRLGPGPELKVGLVWSGGFRQDQPELWSVNRRRNIELALLAPLADTGARFISLQKGADSEAQLHALQAQGWGGPAIEDYTSEIGDFADTAALIDCLDLVISVDTSTAHLAAAMGKPTWILNRLDTCWRWFLEREDSPWYPSVRLYRQTQPEDWAPVVARVRADLQQLVVQRSSLA